MKRKCILKHLASKDLGAKAIRASYDKNWSLSTLQTICRRVDETGSAVTRRSGSGRPTRSALTAEKIAEVGELICSQFTCPRSSENDVIFQRILSM